MEHVLIWQPGLGLVKLQGKLRRKLGLPKSDLTSDIHNRKRAGSLREFRGIEDITWHVKHVPMAG